MPFRLVFFNLKTIFLGAYPGGLARSWSATTEQKILEAPGVPLRLLLLLVEQSQDDLLFLGLIWKIKANQCLSTLVNIMLESKCFQAPDGFVQETVVVQFILTNI